MNPRSNALRQGLSRGWSEFKITLRSADEVGFNVFFVASFCIVLFFQRDTMVEGTSQTLASVVLPSIIGMMVAFSGMVGAAASLSVEREDGTLLRAKATPHGMIGYLIAKVTSLSLTTMASTLLLLMAGTLLVADLNVSVSGMIMLLGVLLLGLVATLPLGAIIGSLVKNPQNAGGLTMLPVGGLAAISGIFYPISALPDWVQAIAQVFPIYWLGLGVRSALLPESAVVAEIGESWRHLEMVAVLGGWAVVGLLLAPPVLRRMAQRESGSAMEERRQRAMQRVS